MVFGAVPCARPYLPSLPVTFPPVIANPVQTKLRQHAQAEGPESDPSEDQCLLHLLLSFWGGVGRGRLKS